MKRTILSLACVAAVSAGCAASRDSYDEAAPPSSSMGSDVGPGRRVGSDSPGDSGSYWGSRGYLETDTPTADSDRRLCQEIRDRIRFGSFSDEGRDVQCKSENGKVTLTGVTADMNEHNAVYHIAREVAGAWNVTNNLEEPLR
jgi:osmotically-inducible protein OsmY